MTEFLPLPDVLVDGKKAKVHSQGLFVTEKHYLVTGRLETEPKRAMLFRFLRFDVSKYESIDLTPPTPAAEKSIAESDSDTKEASSKANLNHPGGFDRDANGVYWIPVSTSNPKGPTVIYGMLIEDNKSLDQATKKHVLQFDDHLGALCCVKDQLLVASWDTKTIYWLNRDGSVHKKLARADFIDGDKDWFLAVQDWKYDREQNLVVAGGLDKAELASWTKGEGPKPATPATLAWIDLAEKSVRTKVLSPMKDVAKPLTNEGMAWFDGELFLLPEDLGGGAKILRRIMSD